MMTLTGEYVGRETGAPSIEAIALGLSRMPRFAGQTVFEWNVADHLVVCMRYIDTLILKGLYIDPRSRSGPPLALHVLLHDAHEAMTGDIPTTFKTDCMRELQHDLDARIYASLKLPMPTRSERDNIKAVDSHMLIAEAKVCTPETTYKRILQERDERAAWPLAVKTVEDYLHEDRDSEEAFLAAFHNAYSL